MESNLTLAVLLTPVAVLAGAAIIKPRETYNWLDKKRYRYNVTLALYMLTPTERFIFSTCLPFVYLSSRRIRFLLRATRKVLTDF